MFTIAKENLAKIGSVNFWQGPGVDVICEIEPGQKFCCSSTGRARRGVHVLFPNGLELSAMWGSENNCDARYDVETRQSATAEVAIRRDGKVVGDVSNDMTPVEVLALIPIIAGLSPNVWIMSTPASIAATFATTN